MAGQKNKLGLSEAEIRLSEAQSSASEVIDNGLYLAFRLHGVRVEIDGPAQFALSLAAAVCREAHERTSQDIG
jgi:hypothetical protein